MNMVKGGYDLTIVHLLNPADRKKLLAEKEASEEDFHGAKLCRYPYSLQSSPFIFARSLGGSGFSKKEVVHVFTGANTLIGLAYVLLARLTGKKAGVSVFGKDFRASRPNALFFLPLLLSLGAAGTVMVNSKSTLAQLPPIFRKKAKILYPGIDPASLGQGATKNNPPEAGRVLFVGRLVRRKGVAELLKAFEKVIQSVPSSRLIIVGDGPFRAELESLIASSPARNSVELKGMLEGKDLLNEYSRCSVFAMPSRTTRSDMEGFGMVFLEAAYFGKPAVGTWSGGIPEAIVDGETGLLVQQDDVESMAQKIIELITDKDLSERLGAAARQRVMREFTWEMATRRFLNLYSDKGG